MTGDLMPFAGTIGGGFFVGLLGVAISHSCYPVEETT